MTFSKIAAPAIFSSLGLALALSACSKAKESKSTEAPVAAVEETTTDPLTPAVTAGDGVNMGMIGQLNVSLGMRLAGDAPDSIMAVGYQGGSFRVSTAQLVKGTMNDDGTFDINVPIHDPERQKMKDCLNEDGSLNAEKLATFMPEAVDYPAEEVLDYFNQELAKPESALTWVIVAYKAAAGDRVAEAQSFKFIGLNAGGTNLFALPVMKAKGNLSLGSITIDGDNAVGALEASTDAFDMSADALSSLASTNNAMKALKNSYMNIDPTTGAEVAITPYFTFRTTLAKMTNQFNAAADFSLSTYSALAR